MSVSLNIRIINNIESKDKNLTIQSLMFLLSNYKRIFLVGGEEESTFQGYWMYLKYRSIYT